MASRIGNNARESRRQREKMRRKRLRLIKKRHQELIVRPRDGMLDAYLTDEAFEDMEESEDLQILEGYGVDQGL